MPAPPHPGAGRVETGHALVHAEWRRLCDRFEALAGVGVGINPRLRSVLGRALRRERQGPYTRVEIARWLLEEGDEGDIVDVVRHEAAHVLASHEDPAVAHGALWKRWAGRVGATPERLCQDPDLCARSPAGRLGPKWALTCWDCWREVGFRYRLDRDWLLRLRTACCGAPVHPVELR